MKVYVVTFADYTGSFGGSVYVSSKPYLSKDEATKAHKSHIMKIAGELYEDEGKMMEYYNEHKEYTYIEENYAGIHYLCKMVGFDL